MRLKLIPAQVSLGFASLSEIGKLANMENQYEDNHYHQYHHWKDHTTITTVIIEENVRKGLFR
jgi:hypothetical protein